MAVREPKQNDTSPSIVNDDDEDDDVCNNKESTGAIDKMKIENEIKSSNHTATKLALKDAHNLPALSLGDRK